jgi:hypothetical protein
MRFVFLLAGAAALLAAYLAQAQTDSSAPPAFSQWSVGLRAGTGLNPLAETSDGAFTAVTGGLTGSYNDAVRRCSIQLGAWLEDEQLNPHRVGITHNALLVLPLLVRTGTPASRVHFLLGGGLSVHLTEHSVTELYPSNFRYRRTAGCLLTGLEVRVSPTQKQEATVALTLRAPLGDSIERSNYSTRIPGSYLDKVFAGWLGLTLNVYLPKPARP